MKSSNGTPIRFWYEYNGLVGSEANQDPDHVNRIIAGADEFLEMYPDAQEVVIAVYGDWQDVGVARPDVDLPPQKEGLPQIWDVEAALAAWQSAQFKLATSSGKPILFHYEYAGMIGSEVDHPELHDQIIAACDESLEAYPDMPYIVVTIEGDWDQAATIKPGAKLPPPKEGMPEEPFDIGAAIGAAIAAAALRHALEGGGDGTNPLAALAAMSGFNENCAECDKEGCPIRQAEYVGA